MKNFSKMMVSVVLVATLILSGCPMTSTDVEYPTLTFEQGKKAGEAILHLTFPKGYEPHSYLLSDIGEVKRIAFENFSTGDLSIVRAGRKMSMTVKFDETGRLYGGLYGINSQNEPAWFDLSYFVARYGANNFIIDAQGEIDFQRTSYLARPNGNATEGELVETEATEGETVVTEGEIVQPIEGETEVVEGEVVESLEGETEVVEGEVIEGETVEPLEGETEVVEGEAVVTEGETVEPLEGETEVVEGETVEPLEGETEVVEGETVEPLEGEPVETGPFTVNFDRAAVKISADQIPASSFEMLVQGIPFEEYVEAFIHLDGLTSVSLQDNGDIYLGFANLDPITLDGIIVSVIRNSSEPIEVWGSIEVYDDPWLPSTSYEF